MQQEATQKGPATGTADDRSTSFRAVEGGAQMQSGERLLVEAYAGIWLVVLVFVVSMFRRQRGLDQRVRTLESSIAKARSKPGSASDA